VCSGKSRLCDGCVTERQRDTASECDEDTDTDDNGENEHNEHGSPAVSSSICIPHPAVRDAASARQRSATADTASEHDSTLCDDSPTALSLLCDDSLLAPSADAGCVSDTAAGKDAGGDDGVVPGATASSWSMRGTAYSALSWVSGVVSRSFVREQQLSNNDYNHNPGQTTADDSHPSDTNPSPSPSPNPNCSEIAASDTHPNDTSPSPNPNPGYTAASDNHPHDTNPSSNPNFDRSENTAGDSFVHHSSTEQVADNLQARADGDDVDVATDVHVDVQAGNVSDEQAASVADAATERASSSARPSEASSSSVADAATERASSSARPSEVSSSPVARPSEASSSSVADAASERASSSARPSEASSSSCSDDVFDVISAEEVSDSSLYPLPDPRYILAARRCLPHYCQTVAIF